MSGRNGQSNWMEGSMKSSIQYMRLIFVIVGLLLSECALAACCGEKGDAKAAEVAVLPHFCWTQYIDDPSLGAEFRI